MAKAILRIFATHEGTMVHGSGNFYRLAENGLFIDTLGNLGLIAAHATLGPTKREVHCEHSGPKEVELGGAALRLTNATSVTPEATDSMAAALREPQFDVFTEEASPRRVENYTVNPPYIVTV